MADKKKTSSQKKSGKKSAVKKTPAKKKTAAKKSSSVKKAPVRKAVAAKKTTAKKVPVKKIPVPGESIPETAGPDQLETNLPVPAAETQAPQEEVNSPARVSFFRRLSIRGRTLDRARQAAEGDEEVDPDALERGDDPMSLVDHLDEFRSRLVYILITLLIALMVAFYVSDPVLDYITKPFILKGFKLNIFKITGGFMLKLKTSLIMSILIGVPLIIFHIWQFIKPAIAVRDRRFSRIVLLASILLFYGGVVFVFFLFIPFALEIMLGFIASDMIPLIGADDYLNFLIFFCVSMGILFEMPIIILILTKMGLITPQFLSQKRKYAIVGIFIVAAVITPQPDVISQCLVAGPLYILYEVSIIISRFVYLRKQKELLST